MIIIFRRATVLAQALVLREGPAHSLCRARWRTFGVGFVPVMAGGGCGATLRSRLARILATSSLASLTWRPLLRLRLYDGTCMFSDGRAVHGHPGHGADKVLLHSVHDREKVLHIQAFVDVRLLLPFRNWSSPSRVARARCLAEVVAGSPHTSGRGRALAAKCYWVGLQ